MRDPKATLDLQRRIQADVKARDASRPPEEPKGAMQAGARRYPEPRQ